MTTPVCTLLGIEQPIVQAPMSDITGLAAAVSNAGALGMLWVFVLIIQVARKTDPFYDRLAGTAVVRV